MAAKKKAKRKAREWTLWVNSDGVYFDPFLHKDQPKCRWVRVREVLPRRKTKAKRGKR